MTRALTLTVALFTASFGAFAQAPTFDVVSIKRNTSACQVPVGAERPSDTR